MEMTNFKISILYRNKLILAITLILFGCVSSRALDWKMVTLEGAQVKEAVLTQSSSQLDGFKLLRSAETGVAFTNILTDVKMMVNKNLMNGSGVALGDYDGDGLCDIYFPNINGANVMYKNLGDMKFQDVTRESGVESIGKNSTGAVFADVDGDSDLDLIVTAMGNPNIVFRNDGNGKFSKLSGFPGMNNKYGSNSIALSDVDGDGDLDMYITNFGYQSLVRSGGLVRIMYRNGKPYVRGKFAKRIMFIDGLMFELGEEDYFLINDGNGNFKSEPITSGRFLDATGKAYEKAPFDQGLCVTFRDINGDMAPDLYICNDSFTPDRFFLNDGKGIFKEVDIFNFRKTPFFSMGTDFADIDRDGDDDFIVVDMLSRRHQQRMTQRGTMPVRPQTMGNLDSRDQVRRNNLYLNRGDGSFAEVANFSGVSASGWTWTPVFIDVDLDGWEDLLVTNGFEYDVDDLDTIDLVGRKKTSSLAEQRRDIFLYPRDDSPNYAFRNLKNTRFEEAGDEWGFNGKNVSNGMATADLDNDGDLDIVVSNTNTPAEIYQNITAKPRVSIRLHGKFPNTFGVGARITFEGGPVSQSQEIIAGGRYVSGDDYLRVFAATPEASHSLTVRWRNGDVTQLHGLKANRAYIIDQTTTASSGNNIIVKNTFDETKPENRLFLESTKMLDHKHQESVYDDFQLQALLARKLSHNGPPISVLDYNGDGIDDVAVGAGKGGSIEVRISNKSAFSKKIIKPNVAGDTSALINVKHGGTNQTADLVITEDRYEGSSSENSVYTTSGSDSFAPRPTGSGAVVGADFDGDGTVEFFIAGSAMSGQYPVSSQSGIYDLKGSGYVLKQALQLTGSVRGATAGDLDNNGWVDLIVACEWGNIAVFTNENGVLKAHNSIISQSQNAGLWQSIALIDANQDGLLDIVGGNWGLNDYYSSEGQKPMRLFFEKSQIAGGYPLVESYLDVKTGKHLPYRDRLMTSKVFPELVRTVPTHKVYGTSTIEKIYANRFSRFTKRECNELRSCLFLNLGAGKFEKRPLPSVVQHSPVFSIVTADWQGDGMIDLFITQNFFQQQPDAPKLEAGRGLILFGSGRGTFDPAQGIESGVMVYGEQRGAAWGDFNNDNRPDLIVSQNASDTTLWLNQNGEPGVRVSLAGPKNNPKGLGARLLVTKQDGQKISIPIVAGDGYNSQSSSRPILGDVRNVKSIEAIWPGGKKTQGSIDANSNMITIQY